MGKKACYDWQHDWISSVANNYELCPKCGAVRKKPEVSALPVIEQKEGQEHEPVGETEDCSQPPATGEGGNMDGQKTPASDPARL